MESSCSSNLPDLVVLVVTTTPIGGFHFFSIPETEKMVVATTDLDLVGLLLFHVPYDSFLKEFFL